MSGTFPTNTRMITCPNCKKEVFVYWASFSGCGKKCPFCKKIIYHDYYSKKIKARDPLK